MTARTIRVGNPAVIESASPAFPYAVVFEDDGETGYFYGLDLHLPEGDQILAALQVYEVAAVEDRTKLSALRILWSEDGGRSALLIDGHPQAVFDFKGKRGYCRTNFPPPTNRWTEYDYTWDDQAMTWFKETGNLTSG